LVTISSNAFHDSSLIRRAARLIDVFFRPYLHPGPIDESLPENSKLMSVFPGKDQEAKVPAFIVGL
jgi:hypothetical protein